ncbi:hypothetical protein Dda_4229 [Drechslerella dactyloides]|uniref:Uncharacterized protein n=1 Tax=Drechslerella dactyloides TaxID=74499 RepID=A0AAD6J0V9_DREDA|nr:hypothetical protein Dda_4229 [Drechslerella dactyloides]
MSPRCRRGLAGRAASSNKMQQGQRKRKRTPLSSSFPSSTSAPSPYSSSITASTSSTTQVPLHPRQEAAASAAAIAGDGRPSSLVLPPSTVIDATTTYTNPGLMVLQQLTTVTESGSTIVRSQITVVDIPASQTPLPVNPAADGNPMTFTALQTDSIGSKPPTAMSSTSLRHLPTATGSLRSTSTSSSTAAPQTNDASDKFSPLLLIVVIIAIVLGAVIAAVGICCYRRRKKQKQQLEEGRASQKYGKEVMARIDTGTVASHPDDWPLPQAFATVRTDRDVSMMMRKPSQLLPSPLREGSYPEFPIPPHVVRGMPTRFPVQAQGQPQIQSFSHPHPPSQAQSWARIQIHADEDVRAQAQAQAYACAYEPTASTPTPPPPTVVRHKPVGPLAIAANDTYLRVESGSSKSSFPSPDLYRTGYPSPATLSSRHKSFVSMESAIDPDLSFGANGSRISTQVDGENPNPQYGSFTYWGDYDFSRRPYSTMRSMQSLHDSNVASPRLGALEENSIWEEALMDVDYEARTPTEGTSGFASPRV